MLEVFLHAFNGEDLFDKSFSTHGMGGILVTRHPDKKVRVKTAESDPIQGRLAMSPIVLPPLKGHDVETV